MRYIVALLLGIMLVTTACSSDKESKQDIKNSPEEVFLAELHREFPGQTFLTDEELIKIPTGFCKDLDDGYTISQVFLAADTYADSPQERKIWTEATSEGIVTFCPEYGVSLLEASERQ